MFLIAGCASYGTKVDQGQLSQMEEGITSYDEVVSTLGAPSQTTMNSDGTRTAMYMYSQYQTNASTFIPYVGLFTGGANTENSLVMLEFDENGILQRYSSSEGGADIGTGLLNGRRQ